MTIIVEWRNVLAHCKLQDNHTALAAACMNNDLATISILLKAGAYPNTCNKVESQTVLQGSLRSEFSI